MTLAIFMVLVVIALQIQIFATEQMRALRNLPRKQIEELENIKYRLKAIERQLDPLSRVATEAIEKAAADELNATVLAILRKSGPVKE